NMELLSEMLTAMPSDDVATGPRFPGFLGNRRLLAATLTPQFAKVFADRIETYRLTAAPNENTRRYLTQAHHDEKVMRGLMVILKADLGCALSDEYMTPGCRQLVRKAMIQMSSSHGRLSFVQSLPSVLDLLTMPANETTILLQRIVNFD
ncbi:hypothetical protein ACOI1H_19790, partial [Loktanella sp. DJP18]|uniref:hypothetical protein n=1 Tax=Loktanella sp. DJP18 TaxID=3409788 RepID=UPI003BB591CA